MKQVQVAIDLQGIFPKPENGYGRAVHQSVCKGAFPNQTQKVIERKTYLAGSFPKPDFTEPGSRCGAQRAAWVFAVAQRTS